jgi:hypothetical protein
MAKKRQTAAKPRKPAKPAKPTKPPRAPAAAGVTAERFVRLYKMVQLLSGGPQTREQVARRLRLDVRGFYRDLELLRASGIDVLLAEGRYSLGQDLDDAQALLPFPDPHLTLGEVRGLAKGRTPTHRKLAQTIKGAVPT